MRDCILATTRRSPQISTAVPISHSANAATTTMRMFTTSSQSRTSVTTRSRTSPRGHGHVQRRAPFGALRRRARQARVSVEFAGITTQPGTTSVGDLREQLEHAAGADGP